jgi:hypothetical protein
MVTIRTQHGEGLRRLQREGMLSLDGSVYYQTWGSEEPTSRTKTPCFSDTLR